MEKVRALVIAPYAGLRETVNAISGLYRSRLEVSVVLGDLESGVMQAKKAEEEGFDVIISRGGTAELISQNSSLPVVNIEISGYDYMRSIRLAGNIPGPKALVGFSYITENASSVNTLLQMDVEINTIRSLEEISHVLTRLTSQGCELIIGDVSTCRIAEELGIPSLLLQSGEESVRSALENAIKLVRAYSGKLEQLDLIKPALSQGNEHIVVMDSVGNILFHSVDLVRFSLLAGDLERLFENTEDGSDREIVLLREGGTLRISRQDLPQGRRAYYLHWMQSERRQQNKGISVLNFKVKPAVNEFSKKNSIYDEKTSRIARSFCGCQDSVLITGDFGVGKSDMALAIHRNSSRWMVPYIQIDCAIAKAQSSAEWLKDVSEKLERGACICFENVDSFDKRGQTQILEVLQNLSGKKCRFMATASSEIRVMTREGSFDRRLLQMLGELSLHIPNLKESHKDLERIVGLDIIDANARLGKQIAGVEPEGMEMIKGHTWQQNFAELRQALYQMVLLTNGTYITAETVRETLASREVSKTSGISLQGSLEEIELRIIRQVLEEENGVISRVAERLNVGRSTLWRKLRDAEKQPE